MSSQRSFTPPAFSKFGKYTKDLHKKRFDYEHSVKIMSRSRSGLKVESSVISSDSAELRGSVTATFPRFSFGLLKTELFSDDKGESKASLEIDGLPKGLSITPTFAAKDAKSGFKKPLAGIEVSYAQEYVSASLNAKSDLESHKIDTSLALGDKGISLGGAATLDFSQLSGGGPEVSELNVGMDYEQSDYSTSVYTEKNLSQLSATYFQRLTNDHILGAIFKYGLTGNMNRSLEICTEYRLNKDTTVKAKVEVPTGEVQTHLETRLSNPSMMVGIASSYKLGSQKLAAEKIGVSLSLGDF